LRCLPAPITVCLQAYFIHRGRLFPLCLGADESLGPRILHVWNTAGVASTIAKFSDREFGTHSTVITRKAADRVGLTTYGRAYSDGAAVFFARALVLAGRADLVHVHSLDRIVPWLKRLYGKPIVMHYHGTDIEGRWEEKRSRWSRADYIAVSTPNLLEGAPPAAVHVPNPIDTDVFRPSSEGRDPKSALSFRYGMDHEAEMAAMKLGLNLTWAERWSVPHSEMPALLSKYAYFIDMRKPPNHAVARSVGRAALEALGCGCMVVDWSGGIIDGLPPENNPSAVAAKWHGIYLGLLSGAGGHNFRQASTP
jgi:glycosyltransferase involved in cell wall biosynthesis